MSTLSVGTIQSNTSSPPTIQNSSGTEIGTLCRAWVNFNGVSGASPVIRQSFNVSSVTRNGTGDYTISFTNAMPDTGYSISGFLFSSNGQTNNGFLSGKINTTPATGSIRVNACTGVNTSAYDPDWAMLSFFR